MDGRSRSGVVANRPRDLEAEVIGALRFCDHHRQRYADKVPIAEAGEFLIGDYTEEGTVGGDGEFKVTLIELHGNRGLSLYPHLEVYGEGLRHCGGGSTSAWWVF